jgi:hypothetical protein
LEKYTFWLGIEVRATPPASTPSGDLLYVVDEIIDDTGKSGEREFFQSSTVNSACPTT